MTAHIYIRGEKGGPGSGNWGHAGRPGLVGGSGGGAGMAMGAGQPSGGDNKKANIFLSASTASPHSRSWMLATYEERTATKRAIISELAERSGVDEVIVDDVIQQWAHTSNDEDMRALSLQQAAAEELGLKLSAWQQEKLDGAAARASGEWIRKQYSHLSEEKITQEIAKFESDPRFNPVTSRANERAIIRAMYDNTQEQLAKAGYKPGDTIQLYRGVGYEASTGRPIRDVVNYNGNAVESWSVSVAEANTFAQGGEHGESVSMAVPVSSIVGTARTGFGCLKEGEFVIAGNVPGSKAVVVSIFGSREEV